MKTPALSSLVLATTLALAISATPALADTPPAKPNPEQATRALKEGNSRFFTGQVNHPNTDLDRLILAGSENQADYAYATILTCADSRVPVERIFDAGVMDLFVVRVAGNVCDTDEIGTIEYGLCHVNTPVLVVLGHTQCGAVAAVTDAVEGHGHALERNIPALVDNITPAVQRAQAQNPNLHGKQLAAQAVEENVWQSVNDLFLQSPATRQLVAEGKVAVLGAIYDVGTGQVHWLDDTQTAQLLAQAEADPNKATDAFAQPTQTATVDESSAH